MTFRTYEHGSSDYDQALQLRSKVLREPLGLTYSAEDLAEEAGQIHIGAFEGGQIQATLILVPFGSAVKMRQVAVAAENQGKGIGRKIVEFSEIWATQNGYNTIVLHARETAVPFYERLGYASEGATFSEVTIPHKAMRKALTC